MPRDQPAHSSRREETHPRRNGGRWRGSPRSPIVRGRGLLKGPRAALRRPGIAGGGADRSVPDTALDRILQGQHGLSLMWAGVLTWLDASPARFATAAWAAFAMAAAAGAGASLPWRIGRWWRSRATFAALALLSILAFRWPILCDNRELMDPDESQMMSAALTLNRDPLYWKSVDGQTRGPMDDWPLLALLRIKGRLDYTGARLVSVLLAWACVLCAWLSLRQLFGDGWARLLALPLLAVHAFSDAWSFVPYGSEHVTDALIALASVSLLTSWGAPGRIRRPLGLYIAGLALGAAPFAKLQGAPIVAWVVVFAVWLVCREEQAARRVRPLVALLGGVLTAPAIILLWVVASGTWQDFFESYILDNVRYAGARTFSWAQTPAALGRMFAVGQGSGPFLVWTTASSMAALLAFPLFSRRERRCAVFAAGLAVASAFAAMVPGRIFPHYLQLVFFPAGLLFGTAAGAAVAAARRIQASRPGLRTAAQAGIAAAFLACGLGPQIAWRAHEVQASRGRYAETRGLLQRTGVADEILKHARGGERLGIWGWGPRFWIQTGLVQATRDGNTSRQIDGSQSRARYRERYLSDLVQSRPPVFIDAVGGDNFIYHDRRASGHETFGELNDYIGANYRQVADVEGTRIYVRRDRP